MDKIKNGIIIKKEINCDTTTFDEKTLLSFSYMGNSTIKIDGTGICAVRCEGNFKNKAIWLNNAYDWNIIKDDTGSLCLVPTKKIR